MTTHELLAALVQQLQPSGPQRRLTPHHACVLDGSLALAVLTAAAARHGMVLQRASSEWLPDVPPPPVAQGSGPMQRPMQRAWMVQTASHAHVPALGVAVALDLRREVGAPPCTQLCPLIPGGVWLSARCVDPHASMPPPP